MAKRGGDVGKKDFFLAVVLTALAVFVFVAVYYVKNPKNIFKSRAAVGEKKYVTTCGSLYEWDPSRSFLVDLDDTYYGALTDQYLNFGSFFEYNLTQGVGLNKVSVNNALNPGNGYATTISSENTFPNPIASTTESSMILKFPNPVETVAFQMQYGEPFDLTDVDREVPTWGTDIAVYVRESDGSDSLAIRYKWDVTNIAYQEALQDICFTIGWNKLIGKIVVLIPQDPHTTTGALPPDKLSFDNFEIQVPSKWSPPEEPTEPTPTVSDNPGTCYCLPNGRLKTDNCNHEYSYTPVCRPDGCECVR